MIKKITVFLAVAGLSGCSMFGDSKFSCNAPDGVSCESISGGYANALTSNIPGQRLTASGMRRGFDTEATSASAVTSTKARSDSSLFSSDEHGFVIEHPSEKLDAQNKVAVLSGFELSNRVKTTDSESLLKKQSSPLRSEEVLARATVFPWKDQNGVLHDLSRFYFVLEEADWSVEHSSETNNRGFGRLHDFRGVYGRQQD